MDTNLYNQAVKMLSAKRLEHTLGVRDTAMKLCDLYGGDKEKAEVSAILHDIFRGRTVDELNDLVKKYGLPDKYIGNANLAHGKLAEAYAREEMGVLDPDILNAISYHTTGRKEMTLLEKIVFLADAIEPGRDYPLVEKLRDIAFNESLDRACLMTLDGTINHLINQGIKREDIDIDTLEAYEYFLTKEKETK